MERVLGIGGVFLRAMKDNEDLARWYRDNLGLRIDEQWWGAVLPLTTPDDREGAYTVWSAFPSDTDYFGERSHTFMLNFRVRDLDAMLAQLREKGCRVEDDVVRSDFGAFGYVYDLEGRKVELWQPPDSPPPTA